MLVQAVSYDAFLLLKAVNISMHSCEAATFHSYNLLSWVMSWRAVPGNEVTVYL